MIEKATFEIPSGPEDYLCYEGYHNPQINWNGWSRPYFEKEVATQILKDLNLKYEWLPSGNLLWSGDDDSPPEILEGEMIKVDGVEIFVFELGTGWVWDIKPKWIILTRMPDVQPSWFDDDDRPVVFKSHLEAIEELIDDHISTLKQHLGEVIRGEREISEIDLELTDWVEECVVDEDGSITVEGYGEIYNPKTFVR